MRRAKIELENRHLLDRQREFRMAADVVTAAWMAFPEVAAVAVIGSVARPLWKEVPRFREFRRQGIELWHECGDLDLAVWIDSQDRLGELRRARDLALRQAHEAGTGVSVAGHQVDTFLFEPGTDRYLGRLCSFSQCPKGKPECRTAGCGAPPFNQRIPDFVPHADLLTPASYATLYQRGVGRLRSALDLRATGDGGG
tara:strand:+ start:819 stop:1412 length:594 start_codon:yes stop_codon:yes gene_type:complete